MRVIGGKYRGRILHPPKGLPVRPTTDQAKEALFNILSHRFTLDGAKVLELFAGTGNVGYEFLSRGAAAVTAVDQDPGCVRYIQKTLRELGETESKAICMGAERFVRQATGPYDFVFMDPPYAWGGAGELVATLFANGLVAPEGLVIVEHASGPGMAHLPYFLEMRKYGGSSFSLFQCAES